MKAFLCFTILAVVFTTSWAKPADIVARVPSSFYGGTKWVLFRDDSIPDPPPNVIQAENNVQVLPTYRYQPSYQIQGIAVTPSPIHVVAPIQLPTAPVVSDTESVVVETKSTPVPHYSFEPSSLPINYQKFIKQHQPLVKVTSFGVTAVPQTAVHIQSPSFLDYNRKKKNA